MPHDVAETAYLPPLVPSMLGKIAMVTGANDGIGRATALGSARLGATVVMVCRDLERGRAAQESFASNSGNRAIALMLPTSPLKRRFDSSWRITNACTHTCTCW